MKKIFSLLFFLSFAIANAQTLKFEKGPLPAVLKKAQAENKPVCIFLIPDASVPVPKGFIDIRKDEDTGSFFNENFVCYAPSVKDSAFQSIRKRYGIEKPLAFIYTDASGNLISKKSPRLSSAEFVIRDARAALEKLRSGKTLSWYQEDYKKGNRDLIFLKEFILEREQSDIFTNHRLIEEYAKQLPMQQLNTFNETSFVLQAGPLYDSPLYRVIYSNPKLVDSVYASLPFALRSQINGRIINNTLAEAIKLKSSTLANKAAEYTRAINRKNYRYGNYLSQSRMLAYYKATKDTLRYISQLQFHIDSYFYSVAVDTFKKYREKLPVIAREYAESSENPTALNDSNINRQFYAYSDARIIARAPMELNNAAWNVYLSKTKNENYLTRAILWSRRSILLDPKPAYYDTLAHLLYQLQFYNEAEATEQKAINLSKTGSGDTERYKKELAQIKSRKL